MNGGASRPGQSGLSLPSALAAFAAALALMLLVAPVAGAFGVWGIALVQIVAIGGPVIVVAHLASPRPLCALGLRAPSARALAGAALVGASFWYLNLRFVVPLGDRLAGDDASVARIADILADPTIPLWATLILLAVLPAVCEELLFRGALARALRPLAGIAGAIVLQAVMFSLFHVSPARLLPTLCFGIVLGAIALASHSTLASAVTHGLNNAFAIVLASAAGAPIAHAIDASGHVATAVAAGLTGTGLWLALAPRPPREVRRPDAPSDPPKLDSG